MLYRVYWGWDASCDQGSFLVQHDGEPMTGKDAARYTLENAPQGAEWVTWEMLPAPMPRRCECPDGGDRTRHGACCAPLSVWVAPSDVF
ncbi:MAG: hypothetical protein WC096_08125 [Sphaerochaetaceae bacterium]